MNYKKLLSSVLLSMIYMVAPSAKAGWMGSIYNSVQSIRSIENPLKHFVNPEVQKTINSGIRLATIFGPSLVLWPQSEKSSLNLLRKAAAVGWAAYQIRGFLSRLDDVDAAIEQSRQEMHARFTKVDTAVEACATQKGLTDAQQALGTQITGTQAALSSQIISTHKALDEQIQSQTTLTTSIASSQERLNQLITAVQLRVDQGFTDNTATMNVILALLQDLRSHTSNSGLGHNIVRTSNIKQTTISTSHMAPAFTDR